MKLTHSEKDHPQFRPRLFQTDTDPHYLNQILESYVSVSKWIYYNIIHHTKTTNNELKYH